MAQRSLDRLGVGLRLGPAGYALVKTTRRRVSVACADQDQPIFSAISGYLAATRGFARLRPAALAPPKASQPDAPKSANTHPDATRLADDDTVVPQSQRNHRWHHIRRCRKLSLRSGDSGIDLDLDAPLGLRQSKNGDMRMGKVPPTLTMGHRHPPAQALMEPVMPGAQFVQQMALVPVLTQRPGDPPLGEQGGLARRPLMAAQIERRRQRHQQRAQWQCEA